jgi:hypothetical protein
MNISREWALTFISCQQSAEQDMYTWIRGNASELHVVCMMEALAKVQVTQHQEWRGG